MASTTTATVRLCAAANRLSTVTNWNSNATSHAYDDANRMTTATLPNDVVSTPSYDNEDRMTVATACATRRPALG